MARCSALLRFLAAIVLVVWGMALAQGASAQTISNTARVNWTAAGQSNQTASNTVSFEVAPQAATIDTFVASPGGTQTLSYLPPLCGTKPIATSGATSQTIITASATLSTSLHIGDTFYFRVTAPAANRDPNKVDSLSIVLTTSGGDREAITIFETGTNTGVFVGGVPTSAIPPQPTQDDCRLSIAPEQTISVTVLKDNSGSETPLVSTNLHVLADPFGLVYDSEDGTPVNGATVTIVAAATGLPAPVLAPDGVASWPSTVVTGQTVTDSAGHSFAIATGEYRFPLMPPGDYRLVITPPAPYAAPSKATAAQLVGLLRPDGKAVEVVPASFGGTFSIIDFGPVRVDVPLDRPVATVAITKIASRDRVQPGDAVFYTVVATNTETGHALRNLVITDRPAAELRLRPNSIRVDGAVPSAGVVAFSADGRVLTLALGTLAGGEKHTVTYAMTVRESAAPGQVINKVSAADARGRTGYASAVVQVESDTVTARMTLIGRVTAGGCLASGPRPGIPGIRVMLEDGSFSVTDAEGRYHLDGLVPGDHVVAVAPQTLPEGGHFINCARSTRNAGSATSRFVSGQGGSLVVADFAAELSPESTAALVAFASKRQHPAEPPAQHSALKPGEAPVVALIDDASRSDRASAGADTDWLAVGDGPPAFLFPGLDQNPRAPAVRVVIRHGADQVIDLLADGQAVPKLAFDGTKVAANRGWAISQWHAIPIEGNVVHFLALVKNADGRIVQRLTRDVHFIGVAAEARLVPDRSQLVADGRTRPIVAIRLLDRAGRPVHAGISGTLELSAPYESAEAIDAMQSRALTGLGSAAPHWTVKGDDGIALVELAPTMVSGALQLDFAFVDGQQKRAQTLNAWIVPGDQPWTLVGLAEGAVGTKTIADAMERTGKFDSDLGDHARVAFYAKGRVPGHALLTVAYDSGKQRNDQQLLGAIDPRSYYTVYADGSDRRFDAASRNKLYIRLESRAFYALFGDFETGFNQTRLTRYQRTATGLKGEAHVGGLHAAGFATRVASAHHRDEIQGGGISGPYQLSSRAIIANSESIAIETRDRFRSEVIVDTQTLTRFVDYDIDLLAGTITFKQPILSRDTSQNPQFIVANYEIDIQAAGGQLNAGVRLDLTTANGAMRVGATAVTDTGNGPRTNMGGLDFKARVARGTEVRAEVAATRTARAISKAWIAEVEHHEGRFDVLAYARSMDTGYGVGQTNAVELGRRKFGVDTRYLVTERFALLSSGWIDDSLTDATHREAVQLHGEYRAGRNTLHGGVSLLRDHFADGTSASSTVFDAGETQRLLGGRLEVDASSSIALGKADSVDLPSRHQVTARYTVSPGIKLIGSYEIAKGSAVDARTARAGFEVAPWRGARIASSLGEQNIADYGKRTYAAFGLAQSLTVNNQLSLDATVDSNKVIGRISPGSLINILHPATSGGHLGENGSIAESFTAVTLGAAWRAHRWTATLRGEWRDGEFANRYGVTFGAIRQLGEGSVFGSGITWTKARGIDGTASEIIDGAVAMAHRPADSVLAILTKLEFRSDKIAGATAGATRASGSTALDVNGNARSSRVIGSVSLNLSPRTHHDDQWFQRSEFAMFAAVRYSFDQLQDQKLSATALLGGLDAHIALSSRLEIGGNATVRYTPNDGVTNFSFGPSAGLVPARDLLLTVGYNIVGFRDRDFSAARSTARGVFATFKAKFDTSTLDFLGMLTRT